MSYGPLGQTHNHAYVAKREHDVCNTSKPNHTATQPRNHATTQPRNHATTQPRNHAATQPTRLPGSQAQCYLIEIKILVLPFHRRSKVISWLFFGSFKFQKYFVSTPSILDPSRTSLEPRASSFEPQPPLCAAKCAKCKYVSM